MKLTIQPFGRVVEISSGTDAQSALVSQGISIRGDCGGRGRCGKCRIIVHDHPDPPTTAEKKILDSRQLRKGLRLACQVTLTNSAEVFVPVSSIESRLKILVEGIPSDVEILPSLTLVTLPARPERSARNLSWEELKALPAVGAIKTPSPGPHLLRQLAGLSYSREAATDVVFRGHDCLEIGPAEIRILGLAVDLGTTTIVGYLLDLFSGTLLSHAARTNPQARHGDDVVSRIVYATSEPTGVEELQHEAVRALQEIIEECSEKSGVSPDHIFEMCVVGNTTMHHLLLGLRPFSLTRFPYNPTISEALTVKARDLGIRIHPEGRVYMLPLIAGFLGSDTVGVVLSTRMHRGQALKLAIDFGTNGEIVLGNRNRLVAASCAAGPAFEGSQIHQGMTGSSGAIDHVVINEDGEMLIRTIDDYPPLGICGSGLVDAVAEMRKQGIIREDGRMLTRKEASPSRLAERIFKIRGRPAFLLWQGVDNRGLPKIYLTQRDIRELQLAKGALQAGIRILMRELDVAPDDLDEVLLAGAFGNYVRPESAVGIGLVPPLPTEKITAVGNAAGTGARQALLSVKEREEADAISGMVEYVDLAKHPDFQAEFVQSMAFP